jgi:hypothetical protein
MPLPPTVILSWPAPVRMTLSWRTVGLIRPVITSLPEPVVRSSCSKFWIVPPATLIGPVWLISKVMAWVEALKSAIQVSRPAPPSASGAIAPVFTRSTPSPERMRLGWKMEVIRSLPEPPVMSKRSMPVKSVW